MAIDQSDQVTASRAALGQKWQAARKAHDWMAVPGMATYVNSMVSGKAPNDGGHWSLYAAEKYLIPLANKLGRSLTMVSLGCGAARIEESAIVNFRWPVSELLGLEYDSKLRQVAHERFSANPHVSARFEFFDFNDTESAPAGKFDLVFAHHAIHHATDIEGLLKYVNSLLSSDGLFIGSEFFGPTRFQVEYETRKIIDRLYAIMPDDLKTDLRTNQVHPSLPYATIDGLMKVDPSESARSSDLRTMLFANFPVVEIKSMGGTFLRWLFQYRAGNFDADNQFHRAISDLLIFIEQSFIENRIIKSDDLFFVLKKSTSL